MVLGDVTGHGVPAALVTVAAHVGFTLAVSEFKENEGSFTMGGLLAKVQRSVSVTGGLEASMTFVAARINLATGEAEIFNGGNPCPMLVRGSKVFPIFGVFNRALGNFGQPPGAFSSMSLQLQQGDRILFYTDGMLERRPRDGGKISRMRLAANVAELCSREGSSAESICQGVMSQISAFMNGPLPDDITCIVAEIPLISRAMALQYP
jgi:serine phosphatase RsbU (regulator of sigma subunit)